MRHLPIALILFVLAISIGCKDDPVIELGTPERATAKLVLSERQIALVPDSTVTLQSNFTDTDAMTTANPSLSWTIDDESIAEISSDGFVTAKVIGQTLAMASFEGVRSNPSLITVVESATSIARIDVVPDTLVTEKGKQLSLDYTVWNLNGDRINEGTPIWSSSASAIAEINQVGQIVSRSRGITQVRLEFDGLKSLPIPVSVFGEKKSGSFSGLSDYSANGTVDLQEQPDGSLKLEIRDSFRVDSGPRLDIYLTATDSIDGDSIKLGLLRAFEGAQSFAVPSNVNLNEIEYVIIHCTTYDQSFGRARIL